MKPLELVVSRFLLRDVALDRFLIRVIVGQRGEDLGEGEMGNRRDDLLGVKSELVPAHDPPHGDAGAGDARPTLTNLWAARDERADIHFSRHELHPQWPSRSRDNLPDVRI